MGLGDLEGRWERRHGGLLSRTVAAVAAAPRHTSGVAGGWGGWGGVGVFSRLVDPSPTAEASSTHGQFHDQDECIRARGGSPFP